MAPDPAGAHKGPLAWMARNRVAANLLMLVIIAAGIVGLISVKQEVFPEFSLDMVTVTVPYPGASPEEVEQGIVLAVEEAVSGIDGVKRVSSTSTEGMGTVTVELLLGADPDVVLRDVTNEVDRITTFPEEAEEPTVALAEPRREVINLVLAGDLDLRTLHELAERARSELLSSDEITQVDIGGVPPLEVSIEIPRQVLESYGLTLDGVAQTIRAASLELPGGSIETRTGEVLVRVADRRLTVEQFADIVVRGTADGSNLRLGEIATITDGFADTDQASYYNGQRAVRLTAYRVGDETPASVAEAVRQYADELRDEVPDTVTVAVINDDSEILTERIQLLLKNAGMGFVLVLVILTLFLKARLALWVAVGIPISFLGAFALMPAFDLSINMVSLFALIVTLGLVVDDAIIVGENTYAKIEGGVPMLRAAIEGTKEMVVPVSFSILTTVAAFSPTFFVPGVMGKIFFVIPAVVCSVLLFSWLESFVVLPAHLGHGKETAETSQNVVLRAMNRVNDSVSRGMKWFTEGPYRRAVGAVIAYRYVTLAVAVALLSMSVALVASGIVPFSFFPSLEGDRVTVAVKLPYGAPLEQTEGVREVLERSGQRAFEKLGGRDELVRAVYTRVGEGIATKGHGGSDRAGGSHLLTIEVTLTPSSKRAATSAEVAGTWAELTPELQGIESLTFNHNMGPGAGAAVDVQLSHPDQEVLARVSERLTKVLRGYDDLINVENAWTAGKPRLDFRLLPEARGLGLTNSEVARQVRGAFYGAEALREQRGRNEVKVMVRLPEAQRRSEYDLDRFEVLLPGGGDVPLFDVVSVERTTAPSEIKREDGQRIVDVKGELAPGVPSAREVLGSLKQKVIPRLQQEHPDLQAELVGMQREQSEAFSSLGRFYVIALFVMYAMLAIPFRSYLQPVIIMSAIPFGFVGAVAGHLLMGYRLSIISVVGIIALSGVVVNNSLVLIDATNTFRAEGASSREAIIQGGMRRLRPILLTSLTTFFGLMPMIFETSVQARFLIPMAISLGFGVLFTSLIGLLLVPALYMIVEDLPGRANEKEPEELLASEAA